MNTFKSIRIFGLTFGLIMTAILFYQPALMAQDLDNKGEEFIVSYIPNPLGSPVFTEVHLTADTPTEVTVRYPFNAPTFETTVAVNPGDVTIVEVPNTTASNWPTETPANNAVHLFAEEEFVTYMVNRAVFSSDAALALPVETMNTEYIVMTYDEVFDRAQFVVTAAFDNTTVTITPSNDTVGGKLAGEPFEVELNRGEGYMVRQAVTGTNGGLAGSIVTSDKPVGLTNGNGCTQVPAGTSACDGIFQVGQPVQSWGNEVLVVNLPNRPNGSIYRILASEDDTSLTQNGVEIATLNRGEYHETPPLPGNHVFAGNKPIYVVQFMTGVSSPGAISGDPAMGNMVPTAQFLEDYTFSTVGGSQFAQHWLTVIANNADLQTITIDGAPIGEGQFSPIDGTSFSAATFELTEGTHVTSSLNPHGITVQGYNSADSYMYPGGARFEFINPVGDDVSPVCEIQFNAGPPSSFSGTASDDGVGIFFVQLLSGSENVALNVSPFVPGDSQVTFEVEIIDQELEFSGTVRATDGAGNSCQAQLFSDPECTESSLVNTLFAMDGGALVQRNLAFRSARALRRAGAKRRAVKRIREQAEEVYQSAWSSTWALPETIFSCLKPEFCIESNLTAASGKYLEDVTALRSLINSTARKLNRRGRAGQARRIRKASNKRLNSNLELLSNVPATNTTC